MSGTLTSAGVWAARYGVPGLALRMLARRGDPVARSAVDPAALRDPEIVHRELRALGRLASTSFFHSSAHHDVVGEVLRHPAFHAEPTGSGINRLDRWAAAAVDPHALGPIDAPSLLAVNGAQHARLRKLVSQAFTPRSISSYAARIEAIAHDLLDRAGSNFDLVRDYANPLPITVIADIMGIPEASRPQLLRIGNDAALTLDPALSWRAYRAAEAAIRDAHAMLEERVLELRRDPDDSLFGQLVRARDDGDRLSDDELRTNVLLLIGAGFETTTNLIGSAVELLLRHPDQLASLRADASGWGNAVEEALRYEPPVQLTVRTAGTEVEMAGTTVQAGRPVLLMIGAANRDPAVFDDPDRFDVTRAEARQHLAFSSGAHYCVGAQLARLEATVALRVLFERHPDLAIAAPGTRRRTRVLRGWEQLPVASRATAASSRP